MLLLHFLDYLAVIWVRSRGSGMDRRVFFKRWICSYSDSFLSISVISLVVRRALWSCDASTHINWFYSFRALSLFPKTSEECTNDSLQVILQTVLPRVAGRSLVIPSYSKATHFLD